MSFPLFTHCVISFILGAGIGFVFPYFPFSIIIFVLLTIVLYRRYFSGSIIFLFISGLIGFFYCYPYEDLKIETILGNKVMVTFQVNKAVEDSNFYRNVKVFELYDQDSKRQIKAKRVNLFSRTALNHGKVYMADGVVSKDSFYLNPGMYHQTMTISVTEIHKASDYSPSMVDNLRFKVNDYLSSNFPTDVSVFIKSIVTGSREEMTQEMRDAFSRTGLAHILSISGAHFGLLMFVVFRSFNFILSLLPERLLVNMTIHIRPSQLSAILTAPLVVFYLMLSSMSYPAIRSFIMICFFLIALMIERRRYLGHSISLAGLIIIVLFPDSLTDLSFQLSFLSVLSIYIGMSISDSIIPPKDKPPDLSIKDKALMGLKDSIVITFSATVGIAPLTAYYFNYFSIISPITNLIITPFIGFVILPISILSSMLYVLTDFFPLNTLLTKSTSIMLDSVYYLASLSYADMKVAGFPLIFVFFSLVTILILSVMVASKFHETSKMAPLYTIGLFVMPLLLIIIFKCFYKKDAPLVITFLDVGQGDSSVVELPDGKVIVIDTGKNGFVTSRFLRYRGIRQLNALVISHPQSDHVGGIERLIKEFNVQEIWDNGYVTYNKDLVSGLYHRSLQRGDKTGGAGYNIIIIHPHSNFKPDRNMENNLSLVIKIDTEKNSFLFTGDIEIEAIDDMLHLGDTLKSSVIKIPHHGSRASISRDFIQTVSPNLAIISAGRKNQFHFPHKETMSLLEGITSYTTAEVGAVRIKESKSGELSVLTAMDFTIKRVHNMSDEWSNLKRLTMVWY